MYGFVIDWILAYIIVKMHNFHRVGKNYIFSSKTKIILVWVIRCKYYILKEALNGALLLHFISTLGSNTTEIPLEKQDELCWYCYLKIFTPRKCSATVMLVFFSFKQDFHLNITFPFSLANVNKLTCYKQIYLYFGGRQFLCLCKELHWCPPVEELYSLLLGWYHPWCNFLSYLKKYIYCLLLGLS